MAIITKRHNFFDWIQKHKTASTEEIATAYQRWIDTTEFDDPSYQLQNLIEWVLTSDTPIDTLHRLRAVYSYDDIVFAAKSLSDKQKQLFRPIFAAAFKLPHPEIGFQAPTIEEPPTLTSDNIDCVAAMLIDVCGLRQPIALEAMQGFRQIYHKDLLGKAAAKLSVKNKNTIKDLIIKLNEHRSIG